MNVSDIKQPEKLKYHNKRVAITKEFDFSASHSLYEYDGKCKNLHGHTYFLHITVSGYLDDKGLLIDFNVLKTIYNDIIDKQLDHAYLNSVLDTMNSTVENIVIWIWEQLAAAFSKEDYAARGVRLEELKLYETPTSSVTMKREWFET